jgi:hypothetical protein
VPRISNWPVAARLASAFAAFAAFGAMMVAVSFFGYSGATQQSRAAPLPQDETGRARVVPED